MKKKKEKLNKISNTKACAIVVKFSSRTGRVAATDLQKVAFSQLNKILKCKENMRKDLVI